MAFQGAAASAYQGTKIKTSSPAELTLMLYDGDYVIHVFIKEVE